MKQIALRMPDDLAARIDEARGMVPRERYLRGVIEQHLIAEQGTPPTPAPDAEPTAEYVLPKIAPRRH